MKKINKKLGFIGCGNMASAIIKGLIAAGSISSKNIFISDKNKNLLIKKSRLFKVKKSSDNRLLAEEADIIILAVKPQDAAAVLNEIKGGLTKKKALISIAAGISISYLRSRLGNDVQLVRVMPNIGALAQSSVTALSFSINCTQTTKRLGREIFRSVGLVREVKEDKLDVITALSGSGPAYYAYFAQSLAEAAATLGLSKKLSEEFSIATAKAAVKLLQDTSMSTAELIKKVTSRGGTTEAALGVMKKDRLKASVKKAVKSAAKRAKKLSR